MESLQIIDKFCSSPLANFLNMAYIFMQVMRNAKQSFADVFQNRCSQKFHNKKILQENTYVESLLITLQAWRHGSLLKKRLQHRCFPVKFTKFLRTPFFTEHLWWLLLEMEKHFIFFPFFYYHDLAKCPVFKSFMMEAPII